MSLKIEGIEHLRKLFMIVFLKQKYDLPKNTDTNKNYIDGVPYTTIDAPHEKGVIYTPKEYYKSPYFRNSSTTSQKIFIDEMMDLIQDKLSFPHSIIKNDDSTFSLINSLTNESFTVEKANSLINNPTVMKTLDNDSFNFIVEEALGEKSSKVHHLSQYKKLK